MRLQPWHRARRFFGSLFVLAPSSADSEWANSHLTESEQGVFASMPKRDRAHSIRVARGVSANLGSLHFDESDQDGGWVMAAALLHDVGKSVSGLGTYGRVMATLSGAVAGSAMADHWAEKSGMTRKIGLYLKYPVLGADILALAGSDTRVVDWAAQHHSPEASWTVPVEVGRLLVDADDGKL